MNVTYRPMYLNISALILTLLNAHTKQNDLYSVAHLFLPFEMIEHWENSMMQISKKNNSVVYTFLFPFLYSVFSYSSLSSLTKEHLMYTFMAGCLSVAVFLRERQPEWLGKGGGSLLLNSLIPWFPSCLCVHKTDALSSRTDIQKPEKWTEFMEYEMEY